MAVCKFVQIRLSHCSASIFCCLDLLRLIAQHLAVEPKHACFHFERSCLAKINQIHSSIVKVQLCVYRLAGLLRAIEARLRVIIRTEKIPLHARPCGLRHPDHARGVGLPEMRSKSLENGTMPDIIDHLRLAFEVRETCGGAEFRLHMFEKWRDRAVSALVPVVIRPGVADGPPVRLRDEGFDAFQGWHTWYAKFHTETAIDAIIRVRRLQLIWSGIAQIDLIRTSRIIARVIECPH